MERNLKRFITGLTCFLAILTGVSQTDVTREMRGAWIATVFNIDWPTLQGDTPKIIEKQKQELISIFDKAKKLKLNTICLQVRSMADAIYESAEGEPFSNFISGKRGENPGWDPLAFAVEEAHNRGLELYAWINPFRQSKGEFYDTPADNEAREKDLLLTQDKYTAYNPAIEEVRNHVAAVVEDIITGYRVDGMIFDDYFYPNKMPEDSTAADYHLWQEQAPWMTFGDFRRASVNKAIAQVAGVIEEVRPDVRFGISPAGVACKANTSAKKYGLEPCPVKADDWQWREIYSDPIAWLRQGTIDFISPQIYWERNHRTAPYEPLAKWWTEIAGKYGRHFYSSHSLSNTGKNKWPSKNELRAQVEINQKYDSLDTGGSIFYSAKNLKRLPEDLYSDEALLPIVTWRPARELPIIQNLTFNDSLLTWDEIIPLPASYLEETSPDEIIKYAVFGVGESGEEKLLGVSYKPLFDISEFSFPSYHVKLLDGYGNLGH